MARSLRIIICLFIRDKSRSSVGCCVEILAPVCIFGWKCSDQFSTREYILFKEKKDVSNFFLPVLTSQ